MNKTVGQTTITELTFLLVNRLLSHYNKKYSSFIITFRQKFRKQRFFFFSKDTFMLRMKLLPGFINLPQESCHSPPSVKNKMLRQWLLPVNQVPRINCPRVSKWLWESAVNHYFPLVFKRRHIQTGNRLMQPGDLTCHKEPYVFQKWRNRKFSLTSFLGGNVNL